MTFWGFFWPYAFLAPSQLFRAWRLSIGLHYLFYLKADQRREISTLQESIVLCHNFPLFPFELVSIVKSRRKSHKDPSPLRWFKSSLYHSVTLSDPPFQTHWGTGSFIPSDGTNSRLWHQEHQASGTLHSFVTCLLLCPIYSLKLDQVLQRLFIIENNQI